VVCMSHIGIETFVQTVCDRLAQEKYVAAAPDFYHRQKDNILEEVAHLPPGNPERERMLAFFHKHLKAEVGASAY